MSIVLFPVAQDWPSLSAIERFTRGQGGRRFVGRHRWVLPRAGHGAAAELRRPRRH